LGNANRILESVGDVFINCTDSAIDHDGVPGGTFGKGAAFKPPYSYTLDPTENLEKIIKAYAGPLDGTEILSIPPPQDNTAGAPAVLHMIRQSETEIHLKYLLRRDSPVSASLISVKGRRILQVPKLVKKRGQQEMVLHLDDVNAGKPLKGVYLFSLKAGNQRIVKKQIFY
jgi:hypothetical protein